MAEKTKVLLKMKEGNPKKIRLTLRLDEELHQWLKERGVETKLSVNESIERILRIHQRRSIGKQLPQKNREEI